MKLRITKGRIACAVVLLPVVYVLNAGPAVYFTYRYGLPYEVYHAVYGPLDACVEGTGLQEPLLAYETWWASVLSHFTSSNLE